MINLNIFVAGSDIQIPKTLVLFVHKQTLKMESLQILTLVGDAVNHVAKSLKKIFVLMRYPVTCGQCITLISDMQEKVLRTWWVLRNLR